LAAFINFIFQFPVGPHPLKEISRRAAGTLEYTPKGSPWFGALRSPITICRSYREGKKSPQFPNFSLFSKNLQISLDILY
jgi:hypothetical protein